MFFLSRIPIWAWFLFSLVLCYGTWNPWGFSLYHMWMESSVLLPIKVLIGICYIGVMTIYATETWKSLKVKGLLILTAFFGTLIWIFVAVDLLRIDNIHTSMYWFQIIIACIMTVGLQGGRIYRNLTGVVSVAHNDTYHPGNEHDAIDSHR